MGRSVLRRVKSTPALDTSAYASGDQMGGLNVVNEILCPDGRGSVLTLVTINDKAKQSVAFDIYIFERIVTLAGADNAAADISDADMDYCMGVINVLAADWDALANNSQATLNIHMALRHEGYEGSPPSVNIVPRHRFYYTLVSRGAPTYAAASLVLTFTTETEED